MDNVSATARAIVKTTNQQQNKIAESSPAKCKDHHSNLDKNLATDKFNVSTVQNIC